MANTGTRMFYTLIKSGVFIVYDTLIEVCGLIKIPSAGSPGIEVVFLSGARITAWFPSTEDMEAAFTRLLDELRLVNEREGKEEGGDDGL